MPSQPVLEALEDLHRNLNKMKPAIEQVKITEKLAEEVNKLPGVHKTFIADIQKLEREFHALLKKEFQENAVTITGSVDKVVGSAQQTIAKLTDHNEQILKLRNNI